MNLDSEFLLKKQSNNINLKKKPRTINIIHAGDLKKIISFDISNKAT